MNKEIKKKWVDALRSGEYKQTRGRLRYDDCFCALGVLADLVVKEQKVDEKGEPYYSWLCGILFVKGSGHPYDVAIPQQLIYDVGLGYGETDFVVDLNDDRQKTFNEIADIIEKEF